MGQLGHTKFVILMGMLCAFLFGAINFTMLARRTTIATASSSSNVNGHDKTSAPPAGEALENGTVVGNETENGAKVSALSLTVKMNQSEVPSAGSKQKTSSLDSCQQLIAHENGHWKHRTHFQDDNALFNNGSLMPLMYLPQELMWLKGQNLPRDFETCTRNNNYLLYNSVLGHQCGCGVRGFAPAHSVWVYNTTGQHSPAVVEKQKQLSTNPENYYFDQSPTLRLAKQLAYANATICFSGDSIDYQIYKAFHNNLRRIEQIYQRVFPGRDKIVSVVTREIRVHHATKPGNVSDWFLHGRRPPDGDNSFLTAIRPPPGGYGSIYSILETKAHFRDQNSNGTLRRARIRYYMSYGWSPWNVDFMEDCNVNIMNLGLHYKPYGDHMGKETRNPLMEDMFAAITYLSNFTSSQKRRIAVWRSALPQHFDTHDGHFHGWGNLAKDHTCSDIDKKGTNTTRQIYNQVYDEAFSKLCPSSDQKVKDEITQQQACSSSMHVCSVKPAGEVDYQTIHKFWRDNNCTEHIERERLRLINLGSEKEQKNVVVKGTIMRWNVFDIFDVRLWHTRNKDCSHYCYIAPLFETAFERLEILISPLLATF